MPDDESSHETAPIVLVVCTANVCRSPLAQETLQQGFADLSWLDGVSVQSAGVNAVDDVPMCVVSAEQAAGDPGGPGFTDAHRSRPVTRELVEAAGIVLTAEREHRSAIARLAPGSQAKVFTLKEAAALAAAAEERLAGGAGPGDLAALAHLLHSMRGTTPIALPAPPPTGLFARFRRRAEPADPLTIPDGHGEAEPQHRQAARATRDVAVEVAARFAALV